MAANRDEHVGSGIDTPDPRSQWEKVGNDVKSVMSKADPSGRVMPRNEDTKSGQGAQQ